MVAERVLLDLRDTSWKKPPASTSATAHVVIRSAEEPARLRRSGRADSCTDDYVATRAAERFEVSALWNAPPDPPKSADLYRPSVKACPGCAANGYLVLASVRVPKEGTIIQPRHIRIRF